LILGSAAYLASEVATGTPVGPLSDAWSLGGLLFVCVEVRPPTGAPRSPPWPPSSGTPSRRSRTPAGSAG